VKPADYHSILAALDQALDIFTRADGEHSEDDRELLQRLAIIRSQVLKAESGHPFPLSTHPDLAQNFSSRTSDEPPPFRPSSGSTPPMRKRLNGSPPHPLGPAKRPWPKQVGLCLMWTCGKSTKPLPWCPWP
jgi:hypothetical protein